MLLPLLLLLLLLHLLLLLLPRNTLFLMKRGRLVVSCGSGWKTAGYFMMKLPHLFMKTQRDSDGTPDVDRLYGFPAAGTAHP